ncbi:putative hemin transport protein [Filimonas lacunae]|uniref:Putative hemin transport protein n=1 Tax=Filimonas lacunae TaxID=477680 RepID=A0A173MMT9_9BACT|nr:ChuX/HutX family heme-like substrate-binding protein [Filimonas lacunae]BAV08711.1 hemin transport protein HmuS [Filimonas lacunae]SIS60407.1 putative hemin transport protein [Filimonas lacunae]
MQTANLSLQDKWISFRKENPRVRIREAAKVLDSTEAEILASFAGSKVLRLNNDFPGLMKRLPDLGYLMVLTRNDSCVHERKGVVEEVSVNNPHVGLIVGKDIDLRMFFRAWAFGFAVMDDEEAGFKQSIQIFDQQGNAVIKIYPQQEDKAAAFEQLVRDFSALEQATSLVLQPAAPAPHYSDATVEPAALQEDWKNLKDTHDFFPMLKKHNVSRLHALKIAGEFAKQVSNDIVKTLLEKAAATNWEIMVFVGNHGNIQIHTGPVAKIVEIPGWINVMDPAFNLHLKLDDIAESWAVKKPSTDGVIHSIELYDAAGEMIVQFFGKRKPGVPEMAEWTEFVSSL